ALAAAGEYLRAKRLCDNHDNNNKHAYSFVSLLLPRLRSAADCDAFASVDGVAYKLAGHLGGRQANEALSAAYLLLRLTARCSPGASGTAELIRQTGPYCIGHVVGAGSGLMRRLSLAALVNCCRASVSLGARLVRLGLLDACLLQLKSADAADEDDQQQDLMAWRVLALARLARLCCLPQSRALRDLMTHRLPAAVELLRNLCQRAADRLAAGHVDPALCQPFFAACCLHRAFLTPTTAASSSSKDVAADIADQPHEQHLANLLTPQHPLLLAELASSIDQRQQKTDRLSGEQSSLAGQLARGLRCCSARSAYLLSTNLPDFIGLEATCRLIGQLAELTNRHRASSEVGDLLAAIASLTAALIRLESAPVALSELAGPALLRLGACASNWLGANSSNNSSSELALNLAADQLRRNSGQLSDLELAELPSLVTACQACLGNSACSSQAGLGHRLLLPTLQVLSLIKRRVGFESWNRLVGDNRLLNQLLVDCSGLAASAAEQTAYLIGGGE
ncbi:hypothetical protein BOX15_Mlig007275g4, partial [Macrostomum lignano]